MIWFVVLEDTTDFDKLPLDFRVLFGYKECMDTSVDEHIKVWAFFDSSIFPIAMNWRRRYVKFEKVILTTARRVGNARLLDFVCAGEGANYQIEYDTSNYSWKVKRVMDK